MDDLCGHGRQPSYCEVCTEITDLEAENARLSARLHDLEGSRVSIQGYQTHDPTDARILELEARLAKAERARGIMTNRKWGVNWDTEQCRWYFMGVGWRSPVPGMERIAVDDPWDALIAADEWLTQREAKKEARDAR
jgi:hypothetical protein